MENLFIIWFCTLLKMSSKLTILRRLYKGIQKQQQKKDLLRLEYFIEFNIHTHRNQTCKITDRKQLEWVHSAKKHMKLRISHFTQWVKMFTQDSVHTYINVTSGAAVTIGKLTLYWHVKWCRNTDFSGRFWVYYGQLKTCILNFDAKSMKNT